VLSGERLALTWTMLLLNTNTGISPKHLIKNEYEATAKKRIKF